MSLAIGLMSGTSLDGVDAVLMDFGSPQLRVLAHRHQAFDPTLQAVLLALNRSGDDELHRAALAANALSRQCADLVAGLLLDADVRRQAVAVVGAHGQTVRHRPGEFDGTGYTLQVLNGALLAERCGIDVACDFRSRDVAAGGQGAPLVPAFHAAVLASPGQALAVLNLGGIANLSLIDGDGSVIGFDCGPANVLLDGFCHRHRGQPCDTDGAWAAAGRVDHALLATLIGDPYFDQLPPKSTGRDRFNMEWLDRRLQNMPTLAAVDVQATLAELTCRTVAGDLQRHAGRTRRLLVCGGGAHNAHVMHRLSAMLPGWSVGTTDARGLGVTQVEAAAFAWLAMRLVQRLPGNCASATGAAGPRLLGALYRAETAAASSAEGS